MQPTDMDDQERPAANEMERVNLQLGGQLAQRGVRVVDSDSPAEKSDILSAVQEFERAVQLCGASSYTNAPDSSRPDDRRFVIPARNDDEAPEAYIARVRKAADDLGAPSGGDRPHPGSAV